MEVSHNGQTWESLGHGLACWGDTFRRISVPIWPIEEYLIRAKHKPSVAERIARLNPNGKPEGEMPRGIHHTRTIRRSGDLDICDRVAFEKKWGRGSYRKLSKSDFVPIGGRRKAVSGLAYMSGPPCAA